MMCDIIYAGEKAKERRYTSHLYVSIKINQAGQRKPSVLYGYILSWSRISAGIFSVAITPRIPLSPSFVKVNL